jgi:hypothetical protein
MADLLKYFQNSYYTDLVSVVVSLFCFALCIGVPAHLKHLRLLKLYLLFYALLRICTFFRIAILQDHSLVALMGIYPDFVFTIFEFYVFIQFFKFSFEKVRSYNLILLLQIGFFSVAIYLLISDFITFRTCRMETLQDLYTIQAMFLLVPCIYYYLNVFFHMTWGSLLEKPKFWITTGLTFFMLSTLPFSTLTNYLRATNGDAYFVLYSIFNLFYCLLFLMILKAFRCTISIPIPVKNT